MSKESAVNQPEEDAPEGHQAALEGQDAGNCDVRRVSTSSSDSDSPPRPKTVSNRKFRGFFSRMENIPLDDIAPNPVLGNRQKNEEAGKGPERQSEKNISMAQPGNKSKLS